MILQVRAHAASLQNRLDAEGCEPFVPANSRQAQELRGATRPRRKNDLALSADFKFLTVASKLHAAGTPLFDNQALHDDVEFSPQIAACQRRLQKAARG